MSTVRIALVLPELLGTYGDGGNATVLAQRLRWRGVDAELVQVGIGDSLPQSCDVYVLGGGEDAPQALATEWLGREGFAEAVDRGASVLAVCAGLQILGRSWTGADGEVQPGLGLLDCETRPKGVRQIGEIVVESQVDNLPLLTGFENHGGVTSLGSGAQPLGRVIVGHGNGVDGVEGVLSGAIIGTYLHGPVLARNPALADLMLTRIVGPLLRLDDERCDALREERLAAALGRRAPRGRGVRASGGGS